MKRLSLFLIVLALIVGGVGRISLRPEDGENKGKQVVEAVGAEKLKVRKSVQGGDLVSEDESLVGFDSLGAALLAARHAVEEIDPAAEYSRGGQFFAANPGQQLRAWFSGRGVELASGVRVEGGEPWSYRADFLGVRRGSVLTEVSSGVVNGSGDRVEISYAELPLMQWFVNREEGLEQGFLIGERPGGEEATMRVEMKAEGSLRPEYLGEEGLRFLNDDGVDVLHYTGLKVWDAKGADLMARMEVLGENRFAIVVNDESATYPITIDPLYANVETRLVERSVAEDNFGVSVSVDGDTAVVGAYLEDTLAHVDAGSAYVFVRSGGSWFPQAKLFADDAAADSYFGASVAVSNDTVIVGADFASLPGLDYAGAAYVFARRGTGWSQEQKLTAGDAAAWDRFGESVALDGDTALVGAGLDDAPETDAGSAYIFVRSVGVWSEQDKVEASDGDEGDRFGSSVALSGDTAVVGAPGDDTAGGEDAGSGYVFVRSGTVWNPQEKLSAPGAAMGDRFGGAVAIEGETAVLGAAGDDTVGGIDAGSAEVFTRSVAEWSHQFELLASDAEAGDAFGAAVAVEGETAVVGAFSDDLGAENDAGSAYVFLRNGVAWTEEQKLFSANAELGDGFGSAVAISGNTVVVGVVADDTEVGEDAGSAAIYFRTGVTWALEAELLADTTPVDDSFGISVALSGDRALVGSFADDTVAGADAGSAYLFERRGSLWAQHSKFRASDGAARDSFGVSVGLSGDRAIVGASSKDTGVGANAGGVYFFEAAGARWNEVASLKASDGEANDLFGSAVSISGDYALVGSQLDDTTNGVDAGSVSVLNRVGGTWGGELKLLPDDGAAGDLFGGAVALSGDTAVIGARTANTLAGADAGRAYVFERSGTMWNQEDELEAPDGAADDRFGSAVAVSGDTALVGVPSDVASGSAHVFLRSGGVWDPEAKLIASDGVALERFGTSVAIDGDVALVGAPDDEMKTGSAYLYLRSGSIWTEELRLTAGVDASADDEFGFAVALSGETALVGAPQDATAGSGAGSAYIFSLGDLPVITQQPVSRTVVPGQSVDFNVVATGSGTLRYQWRKNGFPMEGEAGTTLNILSAQVADEGSYDCVVSNDGGVVTSAAAALMVNSLSELEQTFPDAPTGSDGFALVIIDTLIAGTGWRFQGEQQWRASGVPVGGLLSGDRVIEFRPVPGFIHPPAETISVISGGAATVLNRSYYLTGAAGSGGMTVVLKPDAIADSGVPEVNRAQWRFLGEDDLAWRNSGVTVGELVPGSYLVECKEIPGRTTPPPAVVVVGDGQTVAPILTYFLPEGQTGTEPEVLPFETVSTNSDLPYAFVGQIRSDLGASTGFVVRERVVATAGHVVFDDGSHTAVTGLQWLFQRDSSSHEPLPRTPRGFYLFNGYAAQRTLENTPGSSTPASQELDVAALYFDTPAGRGGFSGFMASDAVDNEWLLSDAQKMLVGYPVEGVPESAVGRMHATPATNVSFELGGSAHTYTTSDIRSFGGNSGGPLCVQFEGGGFFPAAIYLGGTGQSVVRAIDSEVTALFDAAEDSAATGNNNTGGGITLTSVIPVGAPEDTGILQVTIEFEGVEENEEENPVGGWRFVPEKPELEPAYRSSNSLQGNLNSGTYLLEFLEVAGFQPPTQEAVMVTGGELNLYTYTYVPESSEVEAWRLLHFGTTENTGDAADEADPDGDEMTNEEEFAVGTDPTDKSSGINFDIVQELPNGDIEFAYDVVAGHSYALEMTNNLSDWVEVSRLIATSSSRRLVTATPNSGNNIFWRLVVR